jgi:hypothetical protein
VSAIASSGRRKTFFRQEIGPPPDRVGELAQQTDVFRDPHFALRTFQRRAHDADCAVDMRAAGGREFRR